MPRRQSSRFGLGYTIRSLTASAETAHVGIRIGNQNQRWADSIGVWSARLGSVWYWSTALRGHNAPNVVGRRWMLKLEETCGSWQDESKQSRIIHVLTAGSTCRRQRLSMVSYPVVFKTPKATARAYNDERSCTTDPITWAARLNTSDDLSFLRPFRAVSADAIC